MVTAVLQATASLAANRLRSLLGAAAVAVAVTTTVLVTVALNGVERYAAVTTARTFGSNTFVMAQVASPGRTSRRELQEQLARNPPIRRIDTRLLSSYGGAITRYAPAAQSRADILSGNLKLEGAVVTGTSATMAEIRDINIVEGRFFRDDEDRAAAQVAIIGADVADALFTGRSAVGQFARLSGRRFQVIGVQGRIGNATQDRYVWIPLAAHERAFGAAPSLQVFAAPFDGLSPVDAEDHARVSLRAARSLRPGDADNFDMVSPEAARGFVANVSSRIGAAAIPISLMALIAAVIVVTNTVLVSVTQRTRELGIRRALGARRDQIMREVLAEAMLLGLAGGGLGVAAAVAVSRVASSFSPVALSVDAGTVAVAVLAGAGSGVVAGWLPALRATRLDVIAALRSE
jgi:putative ABC transport system permease protein